MKRERPPRSGFRTISVLAYFGLLLVYILFNNLLPTLDQKLRITITIAAWAIFFTPVVVYLIGILIKDIKGGRAGFSAAICVILAVFLGVVVYRLAVIVPNEIKASAALEDKQAAFVTAMTDTAETASDADKKAAYDEWDATQKDYEKWSRQDAIFLLITLVPLFAGWFTLAIRDGAKDKPKRMKPSAGGPDMPPPPPMPEA